MLDKFLFGNKHIPEMYFGNIPVAQIYFGNTLIWEKEGYVPYDDTCTAIVTLSQDKTAWIITVTKDGEDVTSSLDLINPWIYNGKNERVNPKTVHTNVIDLSNHPRGDYHVDLAQITSKTGSYFPSRGSISVPEHIYIGNLLAGDKLVAIEYEPSEDITAQTIEIFTTSSQGDNNKARVKILHESGLYIAAFNSDNGPDAATIYNLSGYKRYVNNQNVVLKAGKKYYIVYQHDDASPGEDTFWPAYFDGENGNYKEYSNNKDTVTTTDITNFRTYLGELNDMTDVFNATENDFFIWTGSSTQLANALLVRSNKGNGTNYKGELGVNTGNIRAEDISAFCAMSENDSFRFMPQNGPIYSGKYAYKSSTTPSNVTDYGSKNTAALRLANLLKDIKSYTAALCTSGPSGWEFGWNPSDIIGHVFKMQSGYTSQISSLTPIDTLPADPINGGFYFIKGGTISGDNDDNVYYYNGSWQKVYDYTTLSSMIDNSGTYGDYMTEIGDNSDLIKQEISNNGIDDNLRSATTGNDRKYYLKINGKEV